MGEAYIVDAVRTAVGKRNGGLSGVHPVDLGAAAWRGLFDRNDVDPGAVTDVIAGCVDAIGGQIDQHHGELREKPIELQNAAFGFRSVFSRCCKHVDLRISRVTRGDQPRMGCPIPGAIW